MQKNNSREIETNQQGVHENLESIVRKHFEAEYKKPIAEHTQMAFDQIRNRVELELNNDTPLLFDSFCGTGISTEIIARNNPDALVIGIDRSIKRLSKTYNKDLPNNAMLVQAECADFWQLAKLAKWKLVRHSLYYPNPYPKSKHIKRRWHAHPAYPLLFSLSGEVELRTNWKIYADEFYQAFSYALEYQDNSKLKCNGVETLSFNNTTHNDETKISEFITLFEKKYFLNGQKLYRCMWS